MITGSKTKKQQQQKTGRGLFWRQMENNVSVWFVDPVWEMWVLMNYTSIELIWFWCHVVDLIKAQSKFSDPVYFTLYHCLYSEQRTVICNG